MKVRIKEKTFHNGITHYYVEFKKFLFWHTVKTCYGGNFHRLQDKVFFKLEDAEEQVKAMIDIELGKRTKSIKIVNVYNIIPAKSQNKRDFICEYGNDCKRCKYFVDEGRYPKGYCEHLNSNVYAE